MSDASIAAIAPRPLTVVVANCVFDADVRDPARLLDRYHAMTGWAEALAGAGAGAVIVVQRFGRAAVVRRGPVEYRFIADGGPAAPPPWFVGARLAQAVGALRPDAVHVDGFIFPAFVAWLRLRLPRATAIVVQDHGGVRLTPARLWQRAKHRLHGVGLGAADGFMFTAGEQAAPWRDAGVIRRRHAVFEVPESSTDMASWPAAAGDALPGRPAILSVARLDANKDPLTVLEGFAQAAAALPEAELTMVYGDDALRPAVDDWLAAHGDLRARIHLRGHVARAALAGLYRSADIFTIGSHREVACFSLIEALSFGVTPAVTDIPAFRALTAGRVGALFPPGDAAALARALVAVAAGDPGARRAAVRPHFERALSWPVVGARALAAYGAAAEGRRAAGRA